MAEIIGVNASTIMRNIEFMRNKYLRRVGSDKNGFWEIIEQDDIKYRLCHECSLEEEQTEETANEHRKDRIDFLKASEVKSTSKEGYAQGK